MIKRREFLLSSAETGEEFTVTFEYDAEDDDAFSPLDLYRVSAQRIQIKKAAWKRWKDMDVYLAGCVCAFRDENPFNLTRDNLIPCQAAWMKYK